MSHSKFYSSLLLLILLNVIIKPIWIFGIDRQVQNITGVAEYGTYFSLLNLSIVFGFLLDWGLSNFINRELAAKKTSLQQQLGSFLTLKLLFAVFYALVVTAIAMLSGVKRWDILSGVIIIQFLTFLFVFLRSIVTANQWFRADAWLSVLDKMLMIVICSAFIFWPVFFGSITIQKFLDAQIFSTIIAIIFVFIVLSFKGVVIKKPTLKFFNRSIIFAALPFAITIFIMSIHVRLDGFLLERMHSRGAYEAGIYAAAYRLLDASNMVGFLISSFFMPFVARLWSEGKPLRQSILQTRHMQLMFSITIVTITVMLAPWLQQILYHRHDGYSVQILQWCLPALIGYALVQVYGTVMTATGSIVSFCYLNAGAVAINVMMNLFLIPQYGAFGCCISALCSQLLLGITTMFFVHKKLNISIDSRSLTIYLLNGLVICGATYILINLFVSGWVLLSLAIVISLSMMLVTKLVSLKSLLGNLKNNKSF